MSRITVGSGSLRATNLGSSSRTPWTKPEDWPELPTITSSDDKFAGLYAVFPNQDNFIALSCAANNGAAGYTVDWGDGVTETFGAGVSAYHNYDYNDPDITVTCSRGYKIVTVVVTPLTGNIYTFSINVKHNQTSLVNGYTSGWLDLAFSSTGVAATNLSLATGSSLNHRMVERVRLYNIGNYLGTNGFFSGYTSLQSVSMPESNPNLTSTLNMFRDCVSLSSVPLFDTSNVTSMSGMFQNCQSLQTVPLFNTANVTNMSNMFLSCIGLQFIPKFNTSKVTTMAGMFNNCKTIMSVPEFDTANVTTMSEMFSLTLSMKAAPYMNTSKVTNMYRMFGSSTYQGSGVLTVPFYDTANVTNMSGMFYDCYNLTSVPPFNTSKVTDMSDMFSMFYGSNGVLETIPQFDTANVTNMSSMFRGCTGLKNIPELDTANVTTMALMFYQCNSLSEVANLNTSKVTTMDSMFRDCSSIRTIPELMTSNTRIFSSMFQSCINLRSVPAINVSNTLATGNYTSMFLSCASLANVRASNFNYTFSLASCSLSNTALDYIFTNLPTVSGQTITITGNYGASTSNTTIATSKGWTVTN